LAGGASGSLDASNMFKPALARGEIQCIGATTLDEYRKYLERDAALERRFQQVRVEEPSIDDTVHFMSSYQMQLEEDGDDNAALRRTMAEAGPGVVFTSLILGLGFGVQALVFGVELALLGTG
jgi:hypothetical protein